MPGMKCDYCGNLLRYQEQIVATWLERGKLVAGYTIEQSGEVGETNPTEAKYHVDCYGKLREQKPDEIPPLPT
jgi:hypothetical protein